MPMGGVLPGTALGPYGPVPTRPSTETSWTVAEEIEVKSRATSVDTLTDDEMM